MGFFFVFALGTSQVGVLMEKTSRRAWTSLKTYRDPHHTVSRSQFFALVTIKEAQTEFMLMSFVAK